MSDAIQRGIVDLDALTRAHFRGPRGNSALAAQVLADLRGGTLSAPEADFRDLAEAMSGLPTLLYNATLRLPDGRRVRPDALAPDAPLVHETNGASAHRRHDLFEELQERHDALTAAGFTVLHNAPSRIRARGREVIHEFRKCYERLAGTGWPPGVVLIEDGR